MKTLFVILSFFIVQSTSAQKVIINGKEDNRPLVWSDFTGDPDLTSEYDAQVKWNIRYDFKWMNFRGDTAILTFFEVVLQLDSQNTWLKKGKETNELLKHEQGHFDIGRICQKELIRLLKETILTRKNFLDELKTLASGILQKYCELNAQYDAETNHSRIKKQQKKWDAFFYERLKDSTMTNQ